MTEIEFVEAIDCRFPYHRPIRWRRLVAQAPRISGNAAFMVVHELCRPPRSAKATFAERKIVFDHLSRRFRHPLLSALRSLIITLMRGESVSVSTAAAAMRKVAHYPGQFSCLSICYFSCYDRSGRLDSLYESILESWNEKAS